MHKVPSIKYVKKAESIGIDAVSIVGYECGGHPGMSDTASMILIPRASQELTIPLIAGGGIVDSRGFVAALSLGADAIVMGTRFIASRECLIHNNFKDLIINGKENDTMIIQKSIHNAMRAYNNSNANKVLEMEKMGGNLEELMTLIVGKITKECYKNGNVDGCVFPIGQSMDLINEIKTVQEIIDEMISDAMEVSNKVGKIIESLEVL